jgi:hypothetical protein
MIHLPPAHRPIRRPMISWLEHGTQPLPRYRPNGVFIFFRGSSEQGITIMHLHRPLLRMPRLLSCPFHCPSSIDREALVSPIVGKVSFLASYLGTKERISMWIQMLKGLQSLSRHGRCSAMLSAIFLPHLAPVTPHLLPPLFPSIFQAHMDRRTIRHIYHRVDTVRVHVRNITR